MVLLFQISSQAVVQLDFDFSIALTFPLTLETWIKIDLTNFDSSLEVHRLQADQISAKNSAVSGNFELGVDGGNPEVCFPKYDVIIDPIWDNLALVVDSDDSVKVFSLFTLKCQLTSLALKVSKCGYDCSLDLLTSLLSSTTQWRARSGCTATECGISTPLTPQITTGIFSCRRP